MYDQLKEFIGHKFRKSLIETEFGITSKPSTSGNPMCNAILERIHQVLGKIVRTFNIQQTYVDKNDPWTGILAAAAFAISSTTNRQKGYSPGQFVFGHDMILQIKHSLGCELIRQQNHTQINKDNTQENINRVDYDYKVGDNFMLTKHNTYKYETPYTGSFFIRQYFTNFTVNLQCGAIQINYNIRRIKPYKLDTKVEDYNSKNMSDEVSI